MVFSFGLTCQPLISPFLSPSSSPPIGAGKGGGEEEDGGAGEAACAAKEAAAREARSELVAARAVQEWDAEDLVLGNHVSADLRILTGVRDDDFPASAVVDTGLLVGAVVRTHGGVELRRERGLRRGEVVEAADEDGDDGE
uniref:Uncharacterized protein n=1 Tax=Arundo donax TaxID=35708 RepID=A0A0A9EYI8_ARUDO